MKKLLLVLSVVAMASFLFVGCLPGVTPVDEVVTIAAIPGVTAPGTGATPVTAITATSQYTGVVTWLPADTTFAAETVYTATITLTPVTGFTLTGVAADFFTVAGATATNPIDSGVVTAVFPATAAAPVTPVAPTITAIPDQEVFWDEDGWTYQVVATLGTGTTLTYSLIGNPVSMNISSTGLITWTTILDVPALHEVTVKVVDNDGLTAEETFIIEVKEPIPPVVEPLIVTIEYDPSYNDGTTTFVRGSAGGCVDVTVTLSEPVEGIAIEWTAETGPTGSKILTASDTTFMVFEGELCFTGLPDCELVCIEVYETLEEWCPACDLEELIAVDVITVDSLPPEFDLDIIFDSCLEGICPPVNSISFEFAPDATGDICDPGICCKDCSGIAFWSIEDITDPCVYCPTLTGTGCPEGEYECGCFLCSDSTTPVEYILKFTVADNVGNEFTDTWTITVDSDCAVTFNSFVGPVVLVEGVYKLYNNCPPPVL